jgi:hypothetical protein
MGSSFGLSVMAMLPDPVFIESILSSRIDGMMTSLVP